MTLSTLMDTPCTLVRRSDSGSTDNYGNATQTETLVTTTCSLQQQRRDEPEAEGETSVTVWDLFLPTGTALDTGDAVLVGSWEYEVIGEPWDATEGTTAVHHVEATVKKVASAGDLS